MKKTALLFIAASVLFISANAQITKGQKMIGGELSFNSFKQEPGAPSKTTVVTITPEIGFGLSGNWIVGAGLIYSNSKHKYGSGNFYSKQNSNIYGFNVFGRKFHPFRDNIGIFGQLEAGAGFGKGKYTEVQGGSAVVTDETDVNTVAASVRPGFYFKPARRLILETNFGGISYARTTYKPEDGGAKSTSSQFNFSLTSSISLSFRVIL